MLLKINGILITLLFVMLLGNISGCYVDTSNTDDEPPAMPRGVRTITGDQQVTVEWYPNAEYDLAGYTVWRGRNGTDFDALVELSDNATRYTDKRQYGTERLTTTPFPLMTSTETRAN